MAHLKKRRTKKRAGRTKLIDVPKRVSFNYLRRLCQAGLIDEQLAIVFGVSVRTLNYWKKNPRFIAVLQRGKAEADKEVVKSLFKCATGFTAPEITSEPVFEMRQEHGEEKKILLSKELAVTKVVLKNYPPNAQACMQWLVNRDPKNWQFRQTLSGDKENPLIPPGARVVFDDVSKHPD
jgi:hypothetical protein